MRLFKTTRGLTRALVLEICACLGDPPAPCLDKVHEGLGDDWGGHGSAAIVSAPRSLFINESGGEPSLQMRRGSGVRKSRGSGCGTQW